MASARDLAEGEIEVYEFRVRGELSAGWYDWLDGFELVACDGETVICGPIRDQAGLYGLIVRLRNLGAELLSVNRRPPADGDGSPRRDVQHAPEGR